LQLDRNYIAGLFDGEGSVSIGCSRQGRTNWAFIPQVSVGNNFKLILETLKEEFGGYLCPVGNGRCWAWHLPGKQAKDFLLAILPALIIKRKQAEVLVDFIEAQQQYRERADFRRPPKKAVRAYPDSYYWFAFSCRWHLRRLNGTFSEEKYQAEDSALESMLEVSKFGGSFA